MKTEYYSRTRGEYPRLASNYRIARKRAKRAGTHVLTGGAYRWERVYNRRESALNCTSGIRPARWH